MFNKKTYHFFVIDNNGKSLWFSKRFKLEVEACDFARNTMSKKGWKAVFVSASDKETIVFDSTGLTWSTPTNQPIAD